MTFASGLQTLTDALATALGTACLTNARATEVKCARDSVDGSRYSVSYDHEGQRHRLNADEIVLALPAHAAAEIIAPCSATASDALASIPYASLVSVCFGFRRKDVVHPMDGFGYFLPASERGHLLGCFWNSSQYRDRASRDHVAISALLGDSIGPQLTRMPDGEAAEAALQEISGTMQIHGKPVYLHCTRWARSIPQYEFGHEQRMERLREFEKDFPGITLAGSYRGGISVGARVADAHRHTRNIIARIGRPRSMRQSSSPIQRSA
jgi:oxygen-dependent protoporphyrinogen oxidase